MQNLLEQVRRLGQSYDGQFSEIIITGTNFSGVDRQNLRELCRRTQIHYCGDLVSGWTTHLVVNSNNLGLNLTRKMAVAAQWQVPIVRLSWLLDSIRHGEPLDEERYLIKVELPENTPEMKGKPASQKPTAAATPTTRLLSPDQPYTEQPSSRRTPLAAMDNVAKEFQRLSVTPKASKQSSLADRDPLPRLPTAMPFGSLLHQSEDRSSPKTSNSVEKDDEEESQSQQKDASPDSCCPLPSQDGTQNEATPSSCPSSLPSHNGTEPIPAPTQSQCQLPTSIHPHGQQSQKWWDSDDDNWIPGSQPREMPSPLPYSPMICQDDPYSPAASPAWNGCGPTPLLLRKKVEVGAANDTTPLDIARPATSHVTESPSQSSDDQRDCCAESCRIGSETMSPVESNGRAPEVDFDGYPSPPCDMNTSPIQDQNTESSYDNNNTQVEDDISESSDDEFEPIVARARAPLPPLPPLPSGQAEPADDTVPVKLLQRAPRGSTVKAFYRLASTKCVKFAEEVHLRKLQLTLSTKDKQRAVQYSTEFENDDTEASPLMLAEPLSFYRPLGEYWQMEYHRLYTAEEAVALAEAAGVELDLPPGFDASIELLRSTKREHVDMRKVRGAVPVRKAKLGVSALRTKAGQAMVQYWRCEIDVDAHGGPIIVLPESKSK